MSCECNEVLTSFLEIFLKSILSTIFSHEYPIRYRSKQIIVSQYIDVFDFDCIRKMTIPFFNDSALKCSGPSSWLKLEDGSDDTEHELWSSWFIIILMRLRETRFFRKCLIISPLWKKVIDAISNRFSCSFSYCFVDRDLAKCGRTLGTDTKSLDKIHKSHSKHVWQTFSFST